MENNENATQEVVQQEEATPQEQPQEAPEQQAEESANEETPQAPSQEVQETEETEDYTPDYSSILDQQNPGIQPDENGYIDPNEFYGKVMQNVEAKMRFRDQESRDWQKIEKKYPDVAKDPELRKMIVNQRIADVVQGGNGRLSNIADNLMGRIQKAQSEGKTEAQVSERVQKSASLASPTSNKTPRRQDDLVSRIEGGDRQATRDLMSQWLEEGKI